MQDDLENFERARRELYRQGVCDAAFRIAAAKRSADARNFAWHLMDAEGGR